MGVKMDNDANQNREAHPRFVYQTPGNVVAADDLTKVQKIELLEYWETDLVAKLRAEAEGMSASQSDMSESEANLAEEQSAVGEALNALRES
jgi:hypothetical protein